MANNDNNKINNFFDYREYNIKIDNNEYNLRLEINENDIYFILSNLKECFEYIYKNKIGLETIINKLELNSSKYSNSEMIYKLFDNKNKKNQISINIIDDNSYNLLIKSLNAFEEEITTEIKLIKEFMNDNDKFKYLFRILKLMKNNNSNLEGKGEIENIKNKLKELSSNINEKDKEIKEELKEKDTIIQKLNEKIINQDNIIKKINYNNGIINKKYEELENNLNEKINNIKNDLIKVINDKINKMINNKMEIMNKKYDEFLELFNNNKKEQNKEFDNKLMNNNSKYNDKNNAINTFEDNDDKNKNYNNNFINNMFLDKNSNKNASIVDIDTISENRSNSPKSNLKNYNIKGIKSNNINNNINDNLSIPPKEQNSYRHSPFQLPLKDSKKEILNSNSNKFNFKENYSSSDPNVISPIIKINLNSDSNEVKNKINITNDFNNNYEKNISSFGKNSLNDILPLIQKKEKEYLEKFDSPENIRVGKNFKFQNNKNNNINKWKKFANYLKRKNLDLTNNINIDKIYIINSLLKKFKNNDKTNDNYDNYVEKSESKIIDLTKVEDIFISDINNIDKDNIINYINNNLPRQESNKNLNYNLKDIFHGNENEPNYQGTNINYINRLDFSKILDKNKFTNLIEEMKKYENIKLRKVKKEDELINNSCFI